MMSLAEQLKKWRSRYQLSKHEAATALHLTIGTLEDLERGVNALRAQDRQALYEKLSRPPGKAIRGPVPDAGYRPGEH